jgi:hypothetical protein
MNHDLLGPLTMSVFGKCAAKRCHNNARTLDLGDLPQLTSLQKEHLCVATLVHSCLEVPHYWSTMTY